MIRKLLTLGLALAVGSGVALAHDYTINYTHLLKVAVPATAQDKPVVAATAKVGVLAMQSFLPGYPHPTTPFTPYWAGEKTITLAKQGDHFFGKVRLDAIEQPPGPRMGPVMVQVTLQFADGDKLVLRDECASVDAQHNTSTYEDFNSALAKELQRFNATTDAAKTSVATVSVYRRGPYAY